MDFDGTNNNKRTNENPDFIRCGGAKAAVVTGIVEPDLGPNDRPVLVPKWKTRGAGLFHGPEYFAEWWDGGNTTKNFWIVLELKYNKGSKKWVHNQSPFHPLKGKGFGDTSINPNDIGEYFSIRCTVDFIYTGRGILLHRGRRRLDFHNRSSSGP